MADFIFMENDEGVHLMSHAGCEYTACGDAFDIDAIDDEVSKLEKTKKRVVTCPRCIEVIKYFRSVRIKK